MAGDLAEADEGEVAMTSADVAGHLGDAIMELTRPAQGRRRGQLTRMIATTASETETAAVGRDLGAVAPRRRTWSCCTASSAPGKTAFVRGLAEGPRRRPADAVSSPTFTLMQEYRGGRLPLFHVDLYRLDDPREIDDLGLDEIADDGVLAIEWAEKLPPRAGAVGDRAHRARRRPIHANYSEIGSSALPS